MLILTGGPVLGLRSLKFMDASFCFNCERVVRFVSIWKRDASKRKWSRVSWFYVGL